MQKDIDAVQPFQVKSCAFAQLAYSYLELGSESQDCEGLQPEEHSCEVA
jgi:hypothetical protein